MPAGRPTKMTELTVKKLEEAFAIGATDAEACFYADISKETLYTYQDKNPYFLDRKNALKHRPVLLARQTVVKNMETDPLTARWYLERKVKKEFSTRTETDITSNGNDVGLGITPDQAEQLLKLRAAERADNEAHL